MTTHQSGPTPWWQVMKLRQEVVDGAGGVDNVQMSLHDAVFGSAGHRSRYNDPLVYGSITHPSGRLVEFMAQIAVRLGAPSSTRARAVWRLDQAMGGGKSHALIGLWHLATGPRLLATTDLGSAVFAKTHEIAGSGAVADDLNRPHCVVMDCDNTTAVQEVDGPARTLGERFLWRLFNGAYKKYEAYKDHTASKAKLAEALEDVGRPVLILVDEVMDHIRAVSARDGDEVLLDMAFLRALLDVVNDVSNCALVLVMIASGKDRMALNARATECREELEDLIVRNGRTTPVTSGGDFADIIRRRLFESSPPSEVVAATAASYAQAASSEWDRKVFKGSGPAGPDFVDQVQRCYPFHPALISLAEDEWSLHVGFQVVRSTIQVFAATAYQLSEAVRQGQWVPALIDSGDMPLGFPTFKDALLESGLVADHKTISNLREVASKDIVDPDHLGRGNAQTVDVDREEGWNDANPKAAERMATAIFMRSLCPRLSGDSGATESEVYAASFVPVNSYGPGDAEAVLSELCRDDKGLSALTQTPGIGKRPRRYRFETAKTLEMLTRAQRKRVTDRDRDAVVTEFAFKLATSGPFNEIVKIDGGPAPDGSLTPKGCRQVIEAAGIDNKNTTRMIVCDSRWFAMLNGDDSAATEALRAAMGLGPDRINVVWASSAVFAVANTRARTNARGIAAEYLARTRAAELDVITADDQNRQAADSAVRECRSRLEDAVRKAYQHVVYLAPVGEHDRELRSLRLHNGPENALNGTHVWNALADIGKAFNTDQFDAKALLFQLRPNDWGKPLSEIRDSFWGNPSKPLLPKGASELATAMFAAITAGDMRLVGEDGSEYAVQTVTDVNLGSSNIRIQKPLPACPACGKAPCECATPPAPTPPPGAVSHPAPVTAPPSVPSAPSQPVVQFTVTRNTALTDADQREAIRQLLIGLADTLDSEQASHINLSAQLTVPPEVAEELTEKANTANATHNTIQF